LKKYYAGAFMLIFTLLVAGCGNKKIEMVENASVSLEEENQELKVHVTLDDVNMEPDTPYQVRLFVSNGELVKTLGMDLFVFEEEYVSRKEGEESKVIEINESLPLNKALTESELRDIVEDEEAEALTIDVLNKDKVFATEVIDTVQ
jgi:phosphotransferase system IIA component